MAVRQGKTFDANNVGLITLQYQDADLQDTVDVLDCIGVITTEPTVRTKTKTCSGATKDEKTYPQYLTVSITAYVKMEAYRDLMGMHTEGLKEGVYAYGINSKSPRLVITARILDDMANTEKIVAYPNATVTSGLTFTVDNDTDEVPKVDLQFKAMMDAKGNFYYEADVSDITDMETWESNFTPELVEKVGA